VTTGDAWLDAATIIPIWIGAFVFGTLAAMILGAKLVRTRSDGSTSFFSADRDGDDGGDGGCGGGCGS
jgi:hypothetical protein